MLIFPKIKTFNLVNWPAISHLLNPIKIAKMGFKCVGKGIVECTCCKQNMELKEILSIDIAYIKEFYLKLGNTHKAECLFHNCININEEFKVISKILFLDYNQFSRKKFMKFIWEILYKNYEDFSSRSILPIIYFKLLEELQTKYGICLFNPSGKNESEFDVYLFRSLLY